MGALQGMFAKKWRKKGLQLPSYKTDFTAVEHGCCFFSLMRAEKFYFFLTAVQAKIARLCLFHPIKEDAKDVLKSFTLLFSGIADVASA